MSSTDDYIQQYANSKYLPDAIWALLAMVAASILLLILVKAMFNKGVLK